ncbi:MAG: ATP-binding protein [Pseudonocardia sp.]|nr:ATP-binding protein [Pseudonocardia sp.]
MFVNRSAELAALHSWWDGREPRMAMVWGRRRVGKTALVRRFADALRSVFHTGAGRGQAAELAVLGRQAATTAGGGIRDLTTRGYVDWDDALDHLAGVAEHEPLLLVLDEFPELARTSPELPNLLRAFLDRSSGRTRLRILLCGSAVRYMAALEEQRQPLYGRMDLTLPVHPFTPADAALMLPGLSPAERATVHGLVGGVPMYLAWWDQAAGLTENLRQLACQPGARLLTEGELVLATEAEVGDYPRAVLHAIAAGHTRHNEIRDVVRTDPTRTLDRLVSLRLIERLQPITETGRTRRRIYRIADNFLAFYLGVLTRYRNEIEAGLGPTILPVLLDSLDDHQGGRWEAAFREHVRRRAAEGRFGDRIVGVGPFWTADGHNEIGVVALSGRARTPVLVGEAKWARQVSAPRLVADLYRKAAALPGSPRDLAVLVCAREEVTHLPEGAAGVTARDIFG